MLKRESLSEKLADIIGKKIIHNELKSGEIIMETQISKEWGVSRSPVRDALHMLETKYLVERGPKGSYKVPEMSADYIENIYDTINMLYQYSFSRAAKRITGDQKEYFRNILETVESSVANNDFDTYIEHISNFGQTILEIAQNPIIEKIALDLMPTAERIQYAAIKISPSHLKKACRKIRQIYNHISRNDPQKAAGAFMDFANTSKAVIIDEIGT